MISQSTFSGRPAASASPHDGPFWPVALLALPAANVALLSLVAFLDDDLFVPVAAVVALGEVALVIAWTRTHGMGPLPTLAAVVGNFLITAIGLVVVFIVVFWISCDGACLS